MERSRDASGSGEGKGETYALDDSHEVLRAGLWEATRGIHFMDEEGDVTRAEFLDEEMGEEIVIARKVLNFHDFG